VIDSFKVIKSSTSQKKEYFGNAGLESFFKTLKTEQIYGNKIISKEQ
jgi:putative transposase